MQHLCRALRETEHEVVHVGLIKAAACNRGAKACWETDVIKRLKIIGAPPRLIEWIAPPTRRSTGVLVPVDEIDVGVLVNCTGKFVERVYGKALPALHEDNEISPNVGERRVFQCFHVVRQRGCGLSAHTGENTHFTMRI